MIREQLWKKRLFSPQGPCQTRVGPTIVGPGCLQAAPSDHQYGCLGGSLGNSEGRNYKKGGLWVDQVPAPLLLHPIAPPSHHPFLPIPLPQHTHTHRHPLGDSHPAAGGPAERTGAPRLIPRDGAQGVPRRLCDPRREVPSPKHGSCGALVPSRQLLCGDISH